MYAGDHFGESVIVGPDHELEYELFSKLIFAGRSQRPPPRKYIGAGLRLGRSPAFCLPH